MPTQERIRRFFPLLNARKINKATYDYVLSLEVDDPDPEGYWDGADARLDEPYSASSTQGAGTEERTGKEDCSDPGQATPTGAMERSTAGMVPKRGDGEPAAVREGSESSDSAGRDVHAEKIREIGELLMTG